MQRIKFRVLQFLKIFDFDIIHNVHLIHINKLNIVRECISYCAGMSALVLSEQHSDGQRAIGWQAVRIYGLRLWHAFG